ncbi:NAD(P)H-binding protein [Zafaria sp. J156]|uniref:NmrA family NAD(P)-binding protein n=1 Tax=Zafaria sp. J156 TaxID=3116490 RepID=UPI002E795FC2|nr:NAD(P)H-binding protein [Zafaria sp. J156]MEE1620928.1 NAD(P)H-binding protein [Zafaria sp. J156]
METHDDAGAGPVIAVAGATGHVGGEAARLLAGLASGGASGAVSGKASGAAPERGHDAGAATGRAPFRLRVLARDPARTAAVARRLGPGVVPLTAAYGDPDAARAALEGTDVLFMVSAAESAHRLEEHAAFIGAAADAGVRHVVYTSFFEASPTAVFTLARDHFATEELLRAAGPAWTFLRDNFYLDVFAHFADADGVIRGPADDGRVSAVARRDVAACAAVVLAGAAADLAVGRDCAHAGRRYELTGPEALTLGEVAAALAAATGRPHRFEQETVAAAYASREPYGAEPWQLDAWVSTYTAIASGELARTTGDVEALTGRPATSLAALLRDGGGTPVA